MSKVNIEINDSGYCRMITEEDSIKKVKNISLNDLLTILNSVSEDEEYESSPRVASPLEDVLPGDNLISTLNIKSFDNLNAKWYILLRESSQVNMKLGGKTYKNVAMPRLLFAIKVANNRCVSIKIASVKKGLVTPDTPIYRYPYSNVFDAGNVCLGNNQISDFDIVQLSNIAIVPEMFLAMENNSHGYGGNGNSNDSSFGYSELLELMENAIFDEEILTRSYAIKTYKDFYNNLR